LLALADAAVLAVSVAALVSLACAHALTDAATTSAPTAILIA
jgi:hypothetical protein